jgi:MFS family permease
MNEPDHFATAAPTDLVAGLDRDRPADQPSADGLFGWWREAPWHAKKALIAAFLGWMLDAFDVMLYSLVLAWLMADLGMSPAVAGGLGSLTLVASAVGGLAFGVVADRYGRTRALMASILIYSIFTGASGLAQTVTQLAVFRVLLGLGMGGEWASGAALVSETWSSEHRGKALGFMQSAWAVGYAAAAAVSALVLPIWGWRAMFFIGVLPALFTLWVRRNVEEPAIWQAARQRADSRSRVRDIFDGRTRGVTIGLTLMTSCTMFAWWGFNLWIPAYLALPIDSGGIGLTAMQMSGLIIAMQVGQWFGQVTFGYVSDAMGRKRTFVIYALTAAAFILAYTSSTHPLVLLLLGPLIAFFGSGWATGVGIVTAEIYRTDVRATAQGFIYNSGRVASAAAPFLVGSIAQTSGFAAALSLTAVAFVLAAVLWIWIPETKGRVLE